MVLGLQVGVHVGGSSLVVVEFNGQSLDELFELGVFSSEAVGLAELVGQLFDLDFVGVPVEFFLFDFSVSKLIWIGT